MSAAISSWGRGEIATVLGGYKEPILGEFSSNSGGIHFYGVCNSLEGGMRIIGILDILQKVFSSLSPLDHELFQHDNAIDYI